MKKILICMILSALILSGCSDTKDKPAVTEVTTVDPGNSQTNAPKDETNTTVSTDKADVTAETIITIPPIPEEGVPEIPDAEVKYTDDKLIVQVDPEGSTYANGEEVNRQEAIDIILQAASQLATKPSDTSPPENPTTTVKEPAVITPETSREPDISDLPPMIETTVATLPDGTVEVDADKENDIFYLAKYVSTGNTDLAITDIKVFSNSKPGKTGVDAFKPGETMLVNLWCNTASRLDSKVYIVPEGADHKNSYSEIEILDSVDMFTAIESGEGQLFFEIKLPDSISPGVYELRFVCGTEEGYIPFHFG